MEGSNAPDGARRGLLRRMPLRLWALLGLLAVGGIATAIEGPSAGTSDGLAVGDCMTAGAEPGEVACDAPGAAMRITKVYDDEYTAGTLAAFGCPAGSAIIEQRALLADDEGLPDVAACAEPVR